MSDVTLPHTITAGQPMLAADVQENDEALRNGINGALDAGNLTTATRVLLGLTDATTVRRGAVSIAGAETRVAGGGSYALLATPDRVQNIALPTNGLILVAYQALWKTSVASDGAAAIFIGANQLKIADVNGAPVAAGVTAVLDTYYYPLFSNSSGLKARSWPAPLSSDSSEVTTGQALGAGAEDAGICAIFAAAGTYDVSVQFNTTASTVTVKNRHLWVWTIGF